MLGDGCFYKGPRCYQIAISFNKKETAYLSKVKKLFLILFSEEKFSVQELESEFLLRTYSTKIAKIFLENGLSTGNKTKRELRIPTWITSNENFIKSFIRGLFDTDGCIYRKYSSYIQIQLKLANKTLMEDVRLALVNLGFNPTKLIFDFDKTHNSKRWKFYLSRQAEIHRFIKEVGFRNPKHGNRYKKIAAG